MTAHGAAGSSFFRYACATNPVRRLPETLRLFEKLNGKAASGDSTAPRGDLCATHLDKTVPLSADDHDVLLHIMTAAAHTRDQKQIVLFNGRAFY